MGLYKRGQVWWMTFTHRGKHYRRSTETPDRKLAQRIYDKIKGDIAEGKWFERLAGEEKTLKEAIDKYLKSNMNNIDYKARMIFWSLMKAIYVEFSNTRTNSLLKYLK